ncbi:hypothetical protein G6F43_007369 [Rhizopus delemar]|nr:hypothetical protein G6F43_007369 [Rhizopus delemar]
MEDVLTHITGPNVVQSSYLEARESFEEEKVKKSDDVEPEAAMKSKMKQNMYNDHSDNTRENNVLVTIKKITFEPEARNSADNLETRYEWFMRWKDSDVDFTNDYIFIDEAGFHINLRNNCKADTGTPVVVKTTKTKTPSYTIIGAIHASSIIHVAIKKPPPKKREASK